MGFNETHARYTMNFLTNFHVVIVELNVATWYVDFGIMKHIIDKLD